MNLLGESRKIAIYGLIGLSVAAIEYGLTILLSSFLFYVLASGCAFLVSLTINYVSSMKLVFKNRRKAFDRQGALIFYITGIFGLLMNTLGLFLLTEFVWSLEFYTAKIIVMLVVFIVNYLIRRILLESRERIYQS
jgi:putative flippase GtrA